MHWSSDSELVLTLQVKSVSKRFGANYEQCEVKFQIIDRHDLSGDLLLRVSPEQSKRYQRGQLHIAHLMRLPDLPRE